MNLKSLLVRLALVGVLAVPVLAKPMSTHIPIAQPVRLGTTELTAGDYRFLIDGNHVTVFNGRKEVAQAEGRWEDRTTKSPYSGIVSNAEGRIIEVRFAGKTSVYVLTD